MNTGTFSDVLGLLKIPEIAGQLFTYLNNKSQQNYNELELSLKAYGFTLGELLKCIDEESFIRSYRDTNSLIALIDIIKSSNQMSDQEKIQSLSLIHDKEIDQQIRAENFALRKIAAICLGVFGSLWTVSSFATKIISNNHKSIPTKALSRLPKLPKKR